ncbi:fibronectin type 3 and ankyrin repeat domains protein 1 [Culicoides brevitarsis]|uniref:fibronectin type 3 and ankyrin repeat domains protein 1 n=1 Tax=Culicoides brevitarsis TaxID=469753 RepID=UPI00307B86F8
MSFKLEIAEKGTTFITLQWNYPFPHSDVFKVEQRYGTNDWQRKYWGTKSFAKITELEQNLCFTFRVVVLQRAKDCYEPIDFSEEIQVTTLSDMSLTNFHRAVQKHQSYILKNGIQTKPQYINAIGKGGASAVAVGVINNNDDAVRLLLENGAQVNQQVQGIERSPLMLAVSRDNLKMARALMEKRPNVNLQDKSGMSAAHFAVDNNSQDLLKFCLDLGANVELRDVCGWTVLLRAVVMQCDAEIILMLLERGADPTVVDKNGLTCLDHAKLLKREDLVEILMNHQVIIKVQ